MSRPARGKLLLVVAFLLTLCAGIVVGMGLSKQVSAGHPIDPIGGPPPSPPASSHGSWFADKLKLSSTQTEQMKGIWSEAMEGTGRELFERRRFIYRERDKAIESLYTEEQQAARERLRKEYETKLAENSREREKLVQEAVEKTKAILSPTQRQTYEQMLRERAERDRDRHRGPSTRSGTQPFDRPPGPGGPFERRRGDDGPDRGGPDRGGPDRGGSERGGRDREGSGPAATPQTAPKSSVAPDSGSR